MKKAIPRYVLNPAAHVHIPSMWTPEPFQIVVLSPNKSYLNSLWIGVVWNILSLPEQFFKRTIVSALRMDMKNFLHSLWAIPMGALILIIEGILGRCVALPITLEQRQNSITMPQKESEKVTREGTKDFILSVHSVAIFEMKENQDVEK